MQAFYDEEGNLVSVEFTAEEISAYLASQPAEQNDYSPHDALRDDPQDFAEKYFQDYYNSCPTNLTHYDLSPEEISEMSYWDTLGLLYG